MAEDTTRKPLAPFSELMLALSAIIDMTDRGQVGHGERVAILSWNLAERMAPELRHDVFWAGLIHDLGAISAPYHITQYATAEAQLAEPAVRAHPQVGSVLLRELPRLHRIADLVLNHHERWDGSGYPRGLTGEQIPLGAQIVHFADSFDLLVRFGGFDPATAMDRFLEREQSQHSGLLWAGFIQLASESDLKAIFAGDVRDLLDDALSRAEAPLDLDTDTDVAVVLQFMARIIDAKHAYTARHSTRVAHYAGQLARAMQLPEAPARDIERAGLLHDAGKVAVPRSTLDAARPLSDEERALIRSHPLRSMVVINRIGFLRHLAFDAGYHHAWFGGGGYPEDRSGEDIPLGARIIAVADTFDAMTSYRPYQPTRSAAEALRIIAEAAGTQFDPAVARAAAEVFGA